MGSIEDCRYLNDCNPINKSAQQFVSETNKKNWFLRRIYILNWIKNYNRVLIVSDIIAGLTLGLTIIPQSLAYASLAGVPTENGLYASFSGAFVYVLFGSVKEVSVGPTSLMSILTLKFTNNRSPTFATLLAFYAGVIELSLGFLNFGFIIDFISVPVTSAFTSATAIIIIATQARNILGIQLINGGTLSIFYQILMRIGETNMKDASLGLFCIIFLTILKNVTSINLKESRTFLKKFLWYISICRNIFIVVLSSFVAYVLKEKFEINEITLSKDIESSLPSFQLPQLAIIDNDNSYNNIKILKELGSGIVIVSVVAILANVAIAKTFTFDKNPDASQEMIALGLCNMFGACFQGIPICGAFTRSALSNASGVQTPMAGLYSGAVVLLSLISVTQYFKYIPKSTLAAILICAVIYLIDIRIVSKLYKENLPDLFAWLGCFCSSITFGVEIGLLCGILINLILLLFKFSKPKINIQILKKENDEFIYCQPKTDITYIGADFLRTRIISACMSTSFKLPVIINCSNILHADYTFMNTLTSLSTTLGKHNVQLKCFVSNNKLKNKIQNIPDIIIYDDLEQMQKLI